MPRQLDTKSCSPFGLARTRYVHRVKNCVSVRVCHRILIPSPVPVGRKHSRVNGSTMRGNDAKKKKLSLSSLRQGKDAIWTPYNKIRPVAWGNTVPARSIGWVTALTPFPTNVRGRDSQRDRLNQPRGLEPLASEADALPTVPRGRHPLRTGKMRR